MPPRGMLRGEYSLPLQWPGDVEAEVRHLQSPVVCEGHPPWRWRCLAACASLLGTAAVATALVQRRRAASGSQPLDPVRTAPVSLVASAGVPGHHIRSQFSGRCLDWHALIVRTEDCDVFKQEQRWSYLSSHRIETPHGQCLDDGGKLLHVWVCRTSGKVREHQIWRYDPEREQIRNLTGFCLEESVVSPNLGVRPCRDSSQAQRWTMAPMLTFKAAGGRRRKVPGRGPERGDDPCKVHCSPPEVAQTPEPPALEHGRPGAGRLAEAIEPAAEPQPEAAAPQPEERAAHAESPPSLVTMAVAGALSASLLCALAACVARWPRGKDRQELRPGEGPRAVTEAALVPLQPRRSAALMADPRPGPDGQRVLGVCGFYFPGYEDRWDRLCKASFLGTFYDQGPMGLELEIDGSQRTFRNAEAAFQALKFWPKAEEFERLSGVQALQKKLELKGEEDYSYGGVGSPWNAMWAVLEAKFQPGSQLGQALEATGDDFLLEHEGQRGSGLDGVWDENCDVGCPNWLGLQLMLLRDRHRGETRWTEYLEGVVDTGMGRAYDDREDGPWQEAVRAAKAALEEAVGAASFESEEESYRDEVLTPSTRSRWSLACH